MDLQFNSLCVLGMGYIGLPTASTFATNGLKVTGVDSNPHILEVLRNGEPHIHEPGLRTLVQAALRSGNLQIASEPVESDAFIIAVPTPVTQDHRADLHHVEEAARSIAGVLRPGNLVVLESTSPPRTTQDLVAPILGTSGLQAGRDFHLAYTPERVLPGQILRELIENARVIGGVNLPSAQAGRDLYAVFTRGEIVLTDSTTAEMVKLMENTYRDVNIAVANEFARMADVFGVNVWEARDLANRHPRVKILRPGPGVGGHCISIDPWFLVEAAPESAQLVRQARLVNDGQPAYVVERIEKDIGGLSGKAVGVLGLSYKADVDDLRESPALEIARLIASRGAKTTTFEPHAPRQTAPGCTAAATLEEALGGADAILLAVAHANFIDLDPTQVATAMNGSLVFDLHGVWDREIWAAAGLDLKVLGAGMGNG
jgi:UDP-N-acetyl-D-mannosaminuronic acid dehydrogenase